VKEVVWPESIIVTTYVRYGMGQSGTQVISKYVFFHKYLLGSDTTAPSGLYARLCHAFSSS